MQKTDTQLTNCNALYPIYLDTYQVKDLVREFAKNEFEKESRYHGPYARYDYFATVHENGDVRLQVCYTEENSFCMSGGTLFSKVIRPFDAEKLAKIRNTAMYEKACVQYRKEEQLKVHLAVLALQAQLFGEAAMPSTEVNPLD